MRQLDTLSTTLSSGTVAVVLQSWDQQQQNGAEVRSIAADRTSSQLCGLCM